MPQVATSWHKIPKKMSDHQSLQTPSARSVFESDDGRQSMSSAVVSAQAPLEGPMLEETPLAHSRAAKQLYATPQTRSVFESDDGRQSLSSADVSAQAPLGGSMLEETPLAHSRATKQLYATPQTRSVFESDDGRQSLSSADVSAQAPLEGPMLEETPLAHSRAAKQLYATPQTRSVFESDSGRQSLSSADVSAEGALEDAMLKETPRAPSRSRAQLYATSPTRSVTMIEYPRIAIEAAHLLPRATKPHLLTTLEFAFNLKYKQLDIDTTRNLGYFRVDQRRSFDHDGFLLLPTRKDLQRVLDLPLSENEPAKTYKEVFDETEFEYRIVPLQLYKDGNTVFRLTDHNHEKIFPITITNPITLPTLKSHANPFFVIANAGPKLHSNMALVPDAIKANRTIYADLLSISTVWTAWMSRKPDDTWKGVRYKPRTGGGNNGGDGGNSGRGSAPEGKGPERHSTRSSSSRHDGSPTPSQGSDRAGAELVGRPHVRKLAFQTQRQMVAATVSILMS
ncbi:hypothetical protein DFH08DRAFT_1073059 [Mycena albidolilacea]|uniref:HNH nuclease domain-containing protein n=1 Tax=Mycena albidolilacea TaxID=1033008 RepID=A0AAD7F3S8_9AGAR|nr:hypothetical protein DFH08DRAFT_1073059 [Mycena albidolilacea]